jgi:hypothetical protein
MSPRGWRTCHPPCTTGSRLSLRRGRFADSTDSTPRSTLRYRLRRIRELSGHDLNGVGTRLNLHIATRARQILRGPVTDRPPRP